MTTSGRLYRRPTWVQTIAIVLIVAVLCILGMGYFLKTKYEKELSIKLGDYSKLDEIRELIDEKYVGEFTEDELMDSICAGYVSGINDKWAYYTPASNLQDLYDNKSGEYAGVGMTVSQDADTGLLSVLEVYKDSPAAKAGIRSTDKLYAVNGQPVRELGLEATAALVKGEAGTSVKLTILRDGEYIDFNVVREIIDRPIVSSELINGEVGYLRITQFTTNAADQFTEKLNNLINLNVKSLIIDVRSNPGGSLTTLLSVLDQVMPEGKLFIEKDKQGNENIYTSDAEYCDLPLVVLANRYSYSAAEYLAAVTQEQGRAYVIGEATTGKGEGQQTFELSDGSAVTFSVIKYFTPNGVSIGEAGGIQPNLAVDMTDDQIAAIGSASYTDDPQIMAAVEYLGGVS